ncbi:head fiber protein [Caproiciproducens faecalis]|jgi:hypothetical protein|uniref:Head fiber protein n=1 Tax=Caproiciproducens faecalis TaxID=2820301 RepID=A0ABS7DJE0_9FIRM|nr:hypothetical protein [Caproiciproducens faecalis]
MSYNTKNYTEQGGEKTVIGGTLEIKEGASVTGLTSTAAPASATALGGVKAAAKEETDTVPVKIGEDGILYVPTYPVVPEIPAAANQADSTATDATGLVADFNALLAKLKAAGLMVPDEE